MIDSADNSDLSCLLKPFCTVHPLSLESSKSNQGFEENAVPEDATVPKLKIHVEEESSEFWEASEQVAPSQVQQLIQHVRSRKKDLDQREADLQRQVYRWEQQVMTTKADLKRKSAGLEQHQEQLNLQRAQLIKLQQSLVNHQTALRAVIEQIVDHCDQEELKLQLGKLRFELNESMDAIFSRWERLKKTLESNATLELPE